MVRHAQASKLRRQFAIRTLAGCIAAVTSQRRRSGQICSCFPTYPICKRIPDTPVGCLHRIPAQWACRPRLWRWTWPARCRPKLPWVSGSGQWSHPSPELLGPSCDSFCWLKTRAAAAAAGQPHLRSCWKEQSKAGGKDLYMYVSEESWHVGLGRWCYRLLEFLSFFFFVSLKSSWESL